jgi:hypothetical protein
MAPEPSHTYFDPAYVGTTLTSIGAQRNDSQCVLCGKSREHVKNGKLILGMLGGVCLECVELCNDIIRADASESEAPADDNHEPRGAAIEP